MSERRLIEVKIQSINSSNNQPRKNLTVEVKKVENPLFSMRRFTLLHTLTTDDEGYIRFKTSKIGEYRISYYKDTSSLVCIYWVDSLRIDNLDNNKTFKLSW